MITSSNVVYLAYYMTGRQSTVVTIEIPASAIEFITNVYNESAE